MSDSIRPVNAASRSPAPSRRAVTARALEPRMLFDAAAVATAAAVADQAAAESPAPVTDTSALFTPPATQSHHEAYVIDKSVQGYESLLSQVPAGAEIFLIDGSQSGLAQLNTALASAGTAFDAIHIISHGTGGMLKLGSDTITLDTLNSHTAALQTLGSHLTADGDLLLYGCDIAGTADGQALLASLASMTGADVAASTDDTGGANGDAVLEFYVGNVSTDPWASVNLLNAPLALEGIYAGREEGDSGGAVAGAELGWAMDGDGNWVVAGGNGEGDLRVWNVVGATRTEQIIDRPAGSSTAFGQAVAISGNTFVVGDPSAGAAGTVYVYRLTGSTWGLLRTIDIASNGNPGTPIGGFVDGNYGSSQWLDISGNHIAVGVPNEGSAGNGQGRVVWLSDTSGGAWSTVASGYFDEPSGLGGSFGASVSIANGLLAIGSPRNDTAEGSVMVYAWGAGITGGPTTTSRVFEVDFGTANARFGAALDLGFNSSNNRYTLAVGAPGEGTNNGELYVYQTGAGNTTFGGAYDLWGRDGAANNYGLAIKVQDNNILVGAPGGTGAVFRYTATGLWGTGDANTLPTGVTETKWDTSSYTGGAGTDSFGRALAFGGGGALVFGAPAYQADDRGAVVFYDNASDTTGSAVFATSAPDKLGYAVDASGDWVVSGGNGNGELQVWRVVGTTRIEQKITPPSGATLSFGAAVSIDGDTFVVGDADAGTAGRVYIYRLNVVTQQWALLTQIDINSQVSGWGLERIGGWADSQFGGNQWLAISGNHIAVGAPNEGTGSGRVAWIADSSGPLDWSTIAAGYYDEPPAPDTDSVQRFGASVAIAEGALVIGAPGADADAGSYGNADTGSNHGLVYVYAWTKGSASQPVAANTDYSYRLGGQADAPTLGAGSFVANARFGAAVDIEYFSPTPSDPSTFRYTLVAGAPGEGANKGEIYIYQSQNNSLFFDTAANKGSSNIHGQTTGGGADNYGLAVAVSQSHIIVGAPNHNNSNDKGVFYYEKANNIWTGLDTNNPAGFGINVLSWGATAYGAAANTAVTDSFGRSVAFANGNNIAAGAPLYGSDDRGMVAFFYARTPVAVNDAFSIGENDATATFHPLANDLLGTETTPTVTILTPVGSVKGLLAWDPLAKTFSYNANNQFEYLSVGQSETVTVRYRLTATTGGFYTEANVVITVTGQNDVPNVDAGIADITKPLTNEVNGVPGVGNIGTPSIGSIEIPFNAFNDVDQIDILMYSLVSVVPITGPAAPGGFITVGGSYNNGTGVNTGSINYNLTGMTANSSYNVTVRANDGQGGTRDFTFVFNVARANENPQTTGVPNQVATEDDFFSQSLTSFFSDPDTTSGPYPEKLTYSIVSQTGPGADWLSISSTGTLAGAASNDNVGTHSVTVRATDIFGNSITSTFNVVVNNTNDAPILVNGIDPTVSIKGETFGFNVKTGAVTWGGGGSPTAPVDNADPDYYFEETDNYTGVNHDSRTPSSGDTITYTAYNAVSGAQITGVVGSGGTASGSNDVSWLSFNGTSFSGTSAGLLGSTITVRLRATDNHGAFTETTFEIGIFPRDGVDGDGVDGALPATPVYAAQLGYDVAMNSGSATTGQGVAGRWAVVGEPGSDSGNGRIRIYENTAYATAGSTPTWVERYSFTTTAADARLGTAVDISADGMRIIAGAPNEDTNGATAGSQQGAVYYFTNNGSGVWAANAKGISPDADSGDRFGTAVAINEAGGVVLVGAPFDDAAGTNAGAAYMFTFGSATAGGKMMPTFDTGVAGFTDESGAKRAGDLYGFSVAFDQNMLVVGAPRDDHHGKQDAGSVYVYSTDNLAQFSKLTKNTASINNYDYFGTSVDVDSFAGRDSVVVVVGTPGDDARATDAGAVYVFRSDTMVTDNSNGGGLTSLTQQARVTAYDGKALDGFGDSVAVDAYEFSGSDTSTNPLRMAVGSALSGTSTGAAYAYNFRTVQGWQGQRHLPVLDVSAPINSAIKFGAAVDVANRTFIIGAPDTSREGGTLSPGTTNQAKAGSFYSFGLAVGSVLEGLSGSVAKVVGSDEPSPVILGNSSGSGGTSPGSSTALWSSLSSESDDSDWMRLLRPVSSWTVESPAARQAIASALVSPVAQASSDAPSYADALLYDQRTLANDTMLVKADAGSDADTVPEKDAQPDLPGKQKQEVPKEKAAPDVAKLIQGFSTQLDVINGAKSQAAQRLLSSLSSLPTPASLSS